MNDNGIVSDRIDDMIVAVLTGSDKPLTVYKIAKEAGLSWATANMHCYKLKSTGVLLDNTFELGVGQKKVFWKLAAKTPTLGEFTK